MAGSLGRLRDVEGFLDEGCLRGFEGGFREEAGGFEVAPVRAISELQRRRKEGQKGKGGGLINRVTRLKDGEKRNTNEGVRREEKEEEKLILPVDRNAGECLVKGSTCAPLITFIPPLDLLQEPAKKRHGAAAADRTPTLKSVTVSPNTKN